MPTPLDLILDPISLTVFAIFGALVLWEALAPARPLPRVRGWRLMTFAAFVVYFFLSSYLPLLWGETLARLRLFDLTGLGTWGGAAAGLLVYEAGTYFWHRSMHGSNVLWRGLHQMHHSSERLDAMSAYWFSPLDMVGWTLLSSFTLTVVVGITPEAAVLVLYAVTFLAILQHTNVRTPRWLGYLVQRPESHSHHHERGVHARNYSDLPVFDLMFGTFHNPPDFAKATGFYDGASYRVADMLAFRDVSRAPMTHKASSDDRAFARDFEAFKIAPGAFDHAAHVRLAYVYLCEGTVDAAADRMRGSLLAFLNHLGVGPAKFHETITRAWIMAVAHFMAESEPCESAQAFMQANPRLLDSKIMLKHYSAEVLFSPAARAAFVRPDLRAIPEH